MRAVTHPNSTAVIGFVDDVAVVLVDYHGLAVLAGFGLFNFASEFLSYQLHAVTDAKYRNILFQNAFGKSRGVLVKDRVRPAGKDYSLRVVLFYII